jgi:exopolysaccharide biosynthesis WecB/TagA/CpsF family protein
MATRVERFPSRPEAVTPEECGLYAVSYLGLPLLAGSFESAARFLVGAARDVGVAKHIVAHVNVANLHILRAQPGLARDLAGSSVMLCDGIGLKLGAALHGEGWVDDLNGTDLFPIVMQRLARANARVYLLGATAAVVEAAACTTRSRYPGLAVVGAEHGYFDTSDEPAVVNRVNAANPDVLLVGRGFGRQEAFAIRHRDDLRVPLIWTVGGLFDIVSGRAPRAPDWMRQCRLEWLFRFAREPRRMWRRNVIVAPWFLGWVVWRRLAKRTTAPSGARTSVRSS